jgi:predicted Zn-dependent protease
MKFILAVFLCSFSFLAKSQEVSVDQKLGQEGKAQVESLMGIYEDPEKTKLLSTIGNRLVDNLKSHPFPYHFYIVDMGEPNAFALPGGYIFFTRGILALANNEDELAGVMGHEIIHSNNRHAIKQQRKILPGLLRLPGAVAGAVGGESAAKIFSPLSLGGKAITASHSRKHEYEADELGIQLSAKSGYQPEALGNILSTLTSSIEIFTGKKETPSYFADHPLTPERVNRITKQSKALKQSSLSKIFEDRKSFLEFIDGMIVGPNPKQGVFKGDWFLHPDLKFKIKMPATWLRENSMSSVAAMDSTGSGIILLEMEKEAKSPKEAAQKFADGFKKKTGNSITPKSIQVNGYTASEVTFENMQQGEKIMVSLLWIQDDKLIYRITGAAVENLNSIVTSSMKSFTSLPNEDRQAITKKIIKIVKAKSGENFKTLSTRTQNTISAELTAAINGMPEDKILQEDELVKVVVEVLY